MPEPGSSHKSDRQLIFISHRHQERDTAIADILSETIGDWGSGNIEICQTSQSGGPAAGDKLRDFIVGKLADCSVVLLVYTRPTDDWSWCMYECGVATDPSSKFPTRIVVFQCLSDQFSFPRPFGDILRVNINQDEIRKFAYDFHKKEGFLPGLEGAFAPKMDPEYIKKRADRLYEELLEVVPRGPRRIVGRWHSLTLKLDAEDAERAVSDANPIEVVKEKCVVSEASDGAMRPFGIDEWVRELSLLEIFESWQEQSKSDKLDWLSELCEEVTRVIKNRQALEVHVPFKSQQPGTNIWYLPVISEAKEFPEEKWEFSLQLFRLPHNGRFIKIFNEGEDTSPERLTH